MKRRRRYENEFKLEAVRLVEEGGRPVADVAFDLDIHPNTLYRWWLERRQDGEEAFPGNGQMKAGEAEVRRLERELQRVREERDILKKAITFFARESK